jgi:hypothetical protein
MLPSVRSHRSVPYHANRVAHLDLSTSTRLGYYRYIRTAPTLFELLADLDAYRLPHKIYDDAYWSNESEVPPTFEFAGRRIPHRSHTERFLQEFQSASSTNSKLLLPRLPITGFKCWEYAAPLPFRKNILEWRPDEGPAVLGRRITKLCRFADSRDAARPVQRRSAKGKQSVINTQWAAQSQVIPSHQCPADCTD